jgi:hypothetical protein
VPDNREAEPGRWVAAHAVVGAQVKLPQDVIREGLERTGWEVVDIQTSDLDWWADEVWVLQSVWQPHGTAYLTFLVDPMWDGPRRKGQHVYAVGASLENPSLAIRWPSASLYLGKHTAPELPGFLAELSALRRAWSA